MGTKQPEAIRTIPEELFLNPAELFRHLFLNLFIDEVRTATLARLDHEQTKDPSCNPNNWTITSHELEIYFAIRTLRVIYGSEGCDYRNFIQNFPKIIRPVIENQRFPPKLPAKFLKMSVHKFDFISRFLDLGERNLVCKLDSHTKSPVLRNNEPVMIHDLAKKFVSFEDKIFKNFQKFKRPNDLVLCVDECMRPSNSKQDQLQVYCPMKPHKYGHKHFLLVDSSGYIYTILTLLPSQFRQWSNQTEFFAKLIPKKFHDRGYNLVCDNYFHTIYSAKYLLNLGISTVCTFRSLRLQKTMGKTQVQALTKKQKPSDFKRQVRVFQCEVPNSRYKIFTYFYWDKKTQDNPTVFLSSLPLKHNASDQLDVPNHSIELGHKKPSVKLYYDSNMGFVDACDRSINKYSIARNYSKGRWIRRYVDTMFDMGLNNSFAIYLEYWEKKLDSDQISDRLKHAIITGKAHIVFMTEVAIGLLTDNSVVSLPSLLLSPFTGPFNSVKSLLTKSRCQCQISKCKSRSRYKCNECKKAYCDEHSTRICRVCFQNACPAN